MENLIVDPGVVLARCGLDETFRDDAEAAIEDAMGDVQAHIKRSLIPEEVVVTGLMPNTAYPLTDVAAWPQVEADDDFKVSTVEDTGGGAYTVTFLLGLDARNEAPIVRFVKAHAAEMLRNNPKVGDAMPKRIRSVSAEGQSLSFDTGSSADGAAGSLPNIKMLDGYKRPMIYRRPTAPAVLWPHA